jgi:hypothetical protein
MGEVTQTVKTGTSKPSADILKTKRHFEVLDGLRGIAALLDMPTMTGWAR